MRHSFFLTLMLLLALAMPAHAEDDEDTLQNDQNLRIIDHGMVKQILKSDMIMLEDNKRYRLENVLVPPFEEPPAVEEMKREFLGKVVNIYTYHAVEDDQAKYGVPYAHVVTTKGVWVQQDMISKGFAWVLCTDTSPQTVDVLKQAEEKARVDNLGFWKEPAYSIKSTEGIKEFTDSYQVVEGRISGVAQGNTGFATFIFGKGKRKEFSVKFTTDGKFQSFWNDPATGDKSKTGLLQWKGRTVRVRGWVKEGDDGPVMLLTRKEQLDVIMLGDK